MQHESTARPADSNLVADASSDVINGRIIIVITVGMQSNCPDYYIINEVWILATAKHDQAAVTQVKACSWHAWFLEICKNDIIFHELPIEI